MEKYTTIPLKNKWVNTNLNENDPRDLSAVEMKTESKERRI